MNLNGLFSFSKPEEEYLNDRHGKLELLGCPFGGSNCKNQLSVINKYYAESNNFKREKNYQKAIELLKEAYYITDELQQPSCVKCVNLFRKTITQSLKEIHKELEKMTTGIFRNKRYQNVCDEAANVLKEIDCINYKIPELQSKL